MKEPDADGSVPTDRPQEMSMATREVQTQQTEIAASIVRSSLAEIETQASAMLNHLEYVRGGQKQTQPPQQPSRDSSEESPTESYGLNPTKKPHTEVLASLEQLLTSLLAEEDGSVEQQEFVLPPLDEASHLAILQHSTAAYLSALERHQLARVVSRLATDTVRWLGGLFKFTECHANYCRDDAECTLQAIRLALVHQQGEARAEARPSGPPSAHTIYLSELSQLFTVQHACRYLGLPLSCIRIVPCQRAEDAQDGCGGRMDLQQLNNMLTMDEAAGRQPLLLLATIGNPLTGVSDDLLALSSICTSQRIWLHCQGLGLAGLALASTWLDKSKRLLSSMTLSLNSWLGLTGVPSVLVHKARASTVKPSTVFDSDPILSNRVSCLSVWSVLQALGADVVIERIFFAFESCQALGKILLQFEGINVLSKVAIHDSSEQYRHDLENSANFDMLFEQSIPVLLFQFDGHTDRRNRTESDTEQTTAKAIETMSATPSPDAEPKPVTQNVEKTSSNAQYYDRLNSWLGQILLRDCGQLSLEMIEHEQHGICIRYCPFVPGYSEQVPRLTSDILATFAGCIETQIEILHSTIRHRARFQRLVAESGVLRLIELHDWAGLGGVYYVPEGWETLLTDQAKGELNKLNTALVEALQATDSAFSHAESSDGLICVRFGMVTSETDVEELLELVVHTARVVQENSKILDTMSEILKKGIEAATIDLQREAEEKLWQEGILRQVPLVGRVVNWWSPPAKETGMKGRSLNLTQGVVESTENIYKYHMQMTPKTSHQLPGNKGPPAPLVQKAINADPDERSVQHSRNASSSSELSGTGSAGRTIIPVLPKAAPQQSPTQPSHASPPAATKPATPSNANMAVAEPQLTSAPNDGATTEP
ncbi:pyridoxal-dependent decarboxylase domain-containing protein 1 [Anopheles funestus]|uniref:Pyridoxal-dependent decarboxylase domain-containing protein 1 n=1 Tax=Anopheles funestus TaxID=62324 RepID=A0A182R252_ANOFN|nr:pyridoxal-dependent decarboxylase domain-containing protein 1 [Anopheles funestus]